MTQMQDLYNALTPVQPLLSFPQVPMQAPENYSSDEFSTTSRGIASLSFNGRTWRFRTNPNSVNFSYVLNTHVDQTFGGRVVQILSCKIEDLVVVVEAGKAGWPYAANLALFLRDFLDYQRNPSAIPGVFQYSTRGWKFSVYALSIPFHDSVETTTHPLELHFKVQEDLTGVVSGAILNTTLLRMRDGIGWKRDKYNSGSSYGTYSGPGGGSGPGNGGPVTIPVDLGGASDLGGAPSYTPPTPDVPATPPGTVPGGVWV